MKMSMSVERLFADPRKKMAARASFLKPKGQNVFQGSRSWYGFLCFFGLFLWSVGVSLGGSSTAYGQGLSSQDYSLIQRAQQLYRQGKYRKALPLYQRSVTLLEQKLGVQHTQTIFAHCSLAGLYQILGQLHKGLKIAEQCYHRSQKQWGKKHQYAMGARALVGSMWLKLSRFKKALGHIKPAFHVMKQVLGASHVQVLSVMQSLATTYLRMGKWGQAETLFKKLHHIRAQTLGASHPHTALALGALALVYSAMGHDISALRYSNMSLLMLRSRLGDKHLWTLMEHTNRARLYMSLGFAHKAIADLKRAIQGMQDKLGQAHPSVAVVQVSLAVVYMEVGRFSLVLPLLQEALRNQRKSYSATHFRVANVWKAIASYYGALGQFTKAIRCAHKALTIYRSIPDLSLARQLGAHLLLGHLYNSNKQYELSIKHLRIAMKQSASLKTGVAYGIAYSNLAYVLAQVGKTQEALRLLKKAQRKQADILPASHPQRGYTFYYLGRLYLQQRNVRKAIQALRSGKAFIEARLGRSHPHLSNVEHLLASAFFHQKKPRLALKSLQRAWQIYLHAVQQKLALASQQHKLKALWQLQSTNARFFSWHQHMLMHPQTAWKQTLARRGLQRLWKSKGLLFRLLLTEKKLTVWSRRKRWLKLYRGWKEVQRQISALTWRGPAITTSQARKEWKQLLNKLHKQRDTLERELSQRTQRFAFAKALRKVSYSQIQNKLPKEGALLEFVRFQKHMDFERRASSKPWGAFQYLVYIVRPGHPPLGVNLGPAAPIERAIRGLRRALSAIPPRHLGGVPRAMARLKLYGQTLRQRLWKPIRRVLGKTKHLYVAPDGLLHLLPLELLRLSKKRYLIESYTVQYVSSGRALLRKGKRASWKKSLVVGAPAFGQPSRLKSKLQFSPLPGSYQESVAVGTLLSTRPLLGVKASKSRMFRLLRSSQPHLFHLSTHAFFLPMKSFNSNTSSILLPSSRGRQRSGMLSIQPGTFFQNPLLRAGVALAGANKGKGTGIVTAQEIALMELPQTQLVVLSGCDTGLGQRSTWRGVSGLRSAFLRAGAQSLLVSLWKVPDRETAWLMRSFYRKLRRTKRVYPSWRYAQRQALKYLRKRDGQAHPLYWAAFVYQR